MTDTSKMTTIHLIHGEPEQASGEAEATKSHSVMECYKADARIAALEAQLAAIKSEVEKALGLNFSTARLAVSRVILSYQDWFESTRERITELEAELHDASVPLEELIGHNVGLLCVAEAVKAISARLKKAEQCVVEYEVWLQEEDKLNLIKRAEAADARLKEAEAELNDWIENRGPKLAAEVVNEQVTEANSARRTLSLVLEQAIAQRDEADSRALGAEARLKEAEGDIEELTFCEDCGEDDIKLKEINAWPPRYCHSCRHKLVMEICELRKRAEAAEARAETAEKKMLDAQDACQSALIGRDAAWADAGRLRAVLEAYPEWTDDDDPQAVGTMQRFVTCIVCSGGGAFNGDGKPSKRMPPTHKPDCARQAALSPAEINNATKEKAK